MARNKIGLQVRGFEELAEKLDLLGGTALMQQAVNDALKSSKQYVNEEIKKKMAASNLPAGGKFSTGDTLNSLDTDYGVTWEGLKASIKVGFDFKKSGPVSIFLMYGTPRHKPPMSEVPGLYDAIYGSKTKKELTKIQSEAVRKVIERVMK